MRTTKTLAILVIVLNLVGANMTFGQKTVTVSPSGDTSGVTDWQNIMDAFAAAGPGSTVELGAGTFYLHKSIVVWDFSGTFKGAGKSTTTVKTVPDFYIPEAGDLFEERIFSFPHHINTETRTFTMSDMTIRIEDITTTWYRDYPINNKPMNVCSGPLVAHGDTYSPTPIDLSVYFEHLDLIGVTDDEVIGLWHYSFGGAMETKNTISGGVAFWGPSSGEGVWKDVHVVNADIGMNMSGVSNALVGGSPADKCIVENAVMAIETRDNDSLVVSHNELYDTRQDAIFAVRDVQSGFITNNIIQTKGGLSGMRLFRGGMMVVTGNQLTFGPGGYDSVVGINLWRSPDSTIQGNTFTGSVYWDFVAVQDSVNCTVQGNTMSGSSVWENIWIWRGDNCLIQGNTFENLIGSAAIWLTMSQQCVVTENTFLNVSAPDGVIWNDGSNNNILDNDYKQSGVTGWGDPWWTNPGCVMLYFGSYDNLVSESGEFLPGTGGAKNHVFDLGTNNRVVGHPANHVSDPGIGQELQQIKDEIAARQQLREEILVWVDAKLTNVRVVGPEGGTLGFSNGVILEIPPGAVDEPTEIEVTDLPCDEVDLILLAPEVKSHEKRCIAGFSIKPDLVLNVPITVFVPVRLEPGEVPIQLEVDLNEQTYRIAETNLVYRGAEGYIEASLHHFSDYWWAVLMNHIEQSCKRWETYGGVEDLCENTDELQPGCCMLLRSERKAHVPDCECCREELMIVESSGIDFSSGKCEILGSDVKVTFPRCEGSPTEYDSVSETSAGCSGLSFEISIQPTSLKLLACQEVKLKATITGRSPDGTIELKPSTFFPKWKSLNENVAVVGKDGTVKALREGTARIQALVSESSKIPPGEAVINVMGLTGTWNVVITSVDDDCPWPEEIHPPYNVNITQDCDKLSVEFPETTAVGTIENFYPSAGSAVNGPWKITSGVYSSSDTEECRDLFDDPEGWLTGGADLPDTECVGIFCRETEQMKGTLSEDGRTITGTLDWFFEYQVDCEYCEIDDCTIDIIAQWCPGTYYFVATKQ